MVECSGGELRGAEPGTTARCPCGAASFQTRQTDKKLDSVNPKVRGRFKTKNCGDGRGEGGYYYKYTPAS